MNNNVRVGMLASLLLVPATLASANEEVNTEQTPVIQEGEQQQVPFNVLANATDRDILISRFSEFHEGSSVNEIASLRDLLNGLKDGELEATDIELINAKLSYVAEITTLTEELKTLKLEIDKLTLTSPTILTDVPAARAEYDRLQGELNLTQTTMKQAIEANTSADKTVLTEKLTLLNNTEEQNIAYIKKYVTNLDTLTSREKAIKKPQQFIEDYIDTNKLTTLEKDTFATDIKEASDFYAGLSPDEKKILAAVKVGDEEVTPYKLLQDAEAIKKAVEKADALFETIKKTNFTSAAAFKTKVTELQKAVEVVGEDYTHLMQNDVAEIQNYLQVLEVINGIDALKPSAEETYREDVNKLLIEFDSISTSVLKSFVTNHKDLLEAQANIDKAVKAEELIAAMTIENAATTLKIATDGYNALSPTQKKIVNNYEVLQAMQKNNTSATSVVKSIDSIKPTLSSSFVSKVNAARLAYEKLGDPVVEGEEPKLSNSQKLVTNIQVLTTLEQFSDVTSKVLGLKMPKATAESVAAYKTAVTEAATAYAKAFTVDISSLPATTKTALEKLLADANKKISTANTDITRAEQIIAAIDELSSTDPAAAPLLERMAIARALYNEKYVAATAEKPAVGTSADAKRLVYNIATLTNLEKQYKTVMKVINDINALPQYYGKTSLLSRIKSVQKAYDSLGSMQSSVYNVGVLKALAPVEKFITEVNALKTKDENYEAKVNALTTTYNELLTSFADEEYAPLRKLLTDQYYKKLNEATTSITAATTVINSINALKTASGAEVGKLIEQIKADYKKVKEKSLVTNYNDFKIIEKNYSTANKVVILIEKIPTATKANAKDYAKKVEDAKKAYDKLTNVQNIYVTNYANLSSVVEAAKVIGVIANLKTSSKNYLTELAAARAAYDALTEVDKEKVINADLLTEGASTEASVQEVIDLINIAVPTATDYLDKLVAARNAYNSLSKVEQNLVTNIKDLTAREKALKPVLDLIDDINKLDPANAKNFISQYKSAMKAYEKLSYADRVLLTNEQRLTIELAPIYNVMEQISKISQSSKTFVEDVSKARAAYNALTPVQKAQISNYVTLTDHELNVQGGATVDNLIRAIKSSEPKDYIANVKAARNAYNALSSANKKAVTLVNELKAEENYIKPVETVIDLISGLSNPRNNLTKQVASIQKAMAKLNNEQKSLITNLDDYTYLSNVVHVYELIEKLKPSDKYYIGNLQAAQSAYGKLSPEEKQRVTNYYKLQEATTNVDGIQVVINIIAGLSSSSSTYFADIEKALDQYKGLPSALKKQVTNYDVLKLAEKNMKAAQNVIKQIEQIDPDVRSFESKVRSARKAYDRLTAEQKPLVSNYIFLTQYELELGLQ
ncbi:hypothetical protein [Solibacillus sp. CAU 1738]|uniref:hypothetical protein n=1 Tax=Solibacillus sp. CAU 1738 TaxID=3140363 RepID=UPI0032608F71